jgi:hypothetical protein
MVERLTAAEAATAIATLINSRPTSPWLGEIQAVIERVSADAELAGSSVLAVKLRALMPPLRAAIMAHSESLGGTQAYREAEARCNELDTQFAPLLAQLWATPPTTLDDLVIRAEIAQFEARDWPSPYQQWPLLSEGSLEEHHGGFELRQLAIAVLQMGGRRYAV